MYKFLISTAESLNETINVNPMSCFLPKVLVLLVIFYKCDMLAGFSSNKSNRSIISYLLRNLAIKDQSSYQIIDAKFFIHYQKSFKEILATIIERAAKFNPPIAEWIFAVPLFHFMMRKCIPYEQLGGLSEDFDDCLTRQV